MLFMAEATNGKRRKKLFLNLLAIVGFVIVIVVVILGLFRLATLSKPWFYSLFTLKAKPSQMVTKPEETKNTPAPDSAPSAPVVEVTEPRIQDVQKAPDLSVNILSV